MCLCKKSVEHTQNLVHEINNNIKSGAVACNTIKIG